MRPTIKTIANLAGVSRGTVDRVLNNRSNVRPDKHQKVIDAIRQLNYKPNMAARVLAFNKNKIKLGVLVPAWSGHFAVQVGRGIEAAKADMRLYGVELVAYRSASNLPDDFIAGIDCLLDQEVKGIAACVVNSVSVREKIQGVVRGGVPVVTFNSDILDSGRVCFVGQDRVKSGRIAAELLAKIVDGRGDVLVAAGNLEFGGHKDRALGFCERWRELGLADPTDKIIQTYNDFDITFEKIGAALAANPNVFGIYMGNESVPGCAEAVGRAALPRKVKLVAHDLSAANIKLLGSGKVDFIIEQDMYFQGYRPIELLTQMLVGDIRCEKEFEHTQIGIVTAENLDLFI